MFGLTVAFAKEYMCFVNSCNLNDSWHTRVIYSVLGLHIGSGVNYKLKFLYLQKDHGPAISGVHAAL